MYFYSKNIREFDEIIRIEGEKEEWIEEKRYHPARKEDTTLFLSLRFFRLCSRECTHSTNLILSFLSTTSHNILYNNILPKISCAQFCT